MCDEYCVVDVAQQLNRKASLRARAAQAGFTLIELMVTLGIVGVLFGVAMPAYKEHTVRSHLVEASSALSTLRASMEQFFQDNRSYASNSNYTTPCMDPANQTAGSFKLSCTATDTSYVITATGSGQTAGFAFTIDQNGNQNTSSLPPDWGNAPQKGCWVQRKGQTC